VHVGKCNNEAENNAGFEHCHRGGRLPRRFTLYSAGSDIVIILPTFKPRIESFHRATVLPVAEGNFPVFSIVPHLKDGCFVGVLIKFEDEIGGEIRVFDDAR